MTTFKRYPKIHRLGKEETEGILLGTVQVYKDLLIGDVSVADK